MLSQKEAKQLFQEFDMRWLGLRSQQGIVGALAGIGNTLEGDHTYELIAYRKNVSIRRKIEREKIIEMQRKTAPGTFSSYDEKTGRVMIMPHGPDPGTVRNTRRISTASEAGIQDASSNRESSGLDDLSVKPGHRRTPPRRNSTLTT